MKVPSALTVQQYRIKRLKSLNLSRSAVSTNSILRIQGDGNCLFRALVQGKFRAEYSTFLSPEEETQKSLELRNSICNDLIRKREFIAPFVEGDLDVYVERMRYEGTWGGEPELAVASDILEHPIRVYMQAGEGNFSIIASYGEFEGVVDINLLFHGMGHYDVLISSQQPQQQSKL